MKNIMVDAYLEKNLGDDLFLYILFNRYKDCDVKWTVNVFDRKYIEIFKEFKNVEVVIKNILNKALIKNEFIRKKKYKKEANENDALLIIGGSMFMESNNGEELMNRHLERTYQYKKNNKKVFVLGTNFGPYETQKFVEKSSKVFSNCTDVCFRERYSYELFKEIDSVRLGSDIVFNLELDCKKIKNTIGISLIGLEDKKNLVEYREDYKKKIIELIETLIDSKKRICLFSFCEIQGDKKISEEIKESVRKKENIEIVEYKGNIKEYLLKFGEMESIVSTRFHAMILSQLFNQNLYPIIYSKKTLNMLKDIELDKKYVRLEDMKNIEIKNLIVEMQQNKVGNLEKIISDAKKQFEKLDEYLEMVN